MLDILQQKLQKRQATHHYRSRYATQTAANLYINHQNKSYISFASNNYLGLTDHPAILQATQRALEKYGVGSGASNLITGYSVAHHELEKALAAFLGRDQALLFSTGYQANLGVVAALVQRKDAIFSDKYNHASLIDACCLSNAAAYRYHHLSHDHLEKLLKIKRAQQKFIITEGVFSMSGEIAPLSQLVTLAQEYQTTLMVDDAHGFGVLGKKGQGISEQYSQEQIPILMVTLGKALGCFGAVVAGSQTLIESCIQYARSYIYTTALPPLLACAALKSLELVQRESWRREKLFSLIHYFKQAAQQRRITILPSDTPIQGIVLEKTETALQWSEALRQKGFWVTAIRPPTVPRNTARLRITLSCLHEEKHIDALLDCVAQQGARLK